MSIKLYPPGGGAPVVPHPAKVDEMKDKGWTTEPVKTSKPKREEK